MFGCVCVFVILYAHYNIYSYLFSHRRCRRLLRRRHHDRRLAGVSDICSAITEHGAFNYVVYNLFSCNVVIVRFV